MSLTRLLPLELYPETCPSPNPPRALQGRLLGTLRRTQQSNNFLFGAQALGVRLAASPAHSFYLFYFIKLQIGLPMQMTPRWDANWDSEPRTTMDFFPFFLSFFLFFNCSSTAAPPTWSSALCSAASYMCFPWAAAGKALLPPARHRFWACHGELVNCTPVGGLGGEQAWGPCQGEKAPPPLHWNSLPFLVYTLGKSNTGYIKRMPLC